MPYDPLLEDLDSLLQCMRMEQQENAEQQYALQSDVIRLGEIVREVIKRRT